MKSSLIQQRPYQQVGSILRDMIAQKRYALNERLPPEREIADILNVSRTLIREALIMLELEGLIEVRCVAGIFVISTPDMRQGGKDEGAQNVCNDAGPFEQLQARQLLESNIVEFAALQVTREGIIKMRQARSSLKKKGWPLILLTGRRRAICISTRRLPRPPITACWSSCSNSPGSGAKIIPCGSSCTAIWIIPVIVKNGCMTTNKILAALIKKDPRGAKFAMWQHLENVKHRLLEFSDVDDIYFDGYLFESWPLSHSE